MLRRSAPGKMRARLELLDQFLDFLGFVLVAQLTVSLGTAAQYLAGLIFTIDLSQQQTHKLAGPREENG